MAIRRIEPGTRLSKAVVHGGIAYLAGITAPDTKADVAGQTKQILDQIDALLKQAGTDKSKLLTAQIWLTDISTFNQMNGVWEKWIDPKNPPARATVEAPLAAPGLTVEIMVIAAIG